MRRWVPYRRLLCTLPPLEAVLLWWKVQAAFASFHCPDPMISVRATHEPQPTGVGSGLDLVRRRIDRRDSNPAFVTQIRWRIVPKRVVPAHTVPRCQFYVDHTIPLDKVGNSLGRQLAVNRVIIQNVLHDTVLTELRTVRPGNLQQAIPFFNADANDYVTGD